MPKPGCVQPSTYFHLPLGTLLQIATMLEISFDMSSPRIEPSVNFLEVFVANREDFYQWLAWSGAALVLILIFMLQAIPAAIQVQPLP